MNAVQLNFVLSFSYMATSASPPPSKRLKSSPIPSHPSHSPSLFQEINDYLHHIKCYTDGLHNDHEQPSSSDTTMMWMLRDKLRDAVTSLKLHTSIHKEEKINKKAYFGMPSSGVVWFKHFRPSCITSIRYLSDDEGQILPFVSELQFHNEFNYYITNFLPSITRITFGDTFNRPIAGLFPSSLTHLSFGRDFDQPVIDLPLKITHLRFGRYFNHPVDNLPPSITSLFFGGNFAHSITNLPNSIIHLRFGKVHQQMDHFPSSLQRLEFGTNMNHLISNLPNSIHTLKFKAYGQHIHSLPSSLTSLSFGYRASSATAITSNNALPPLLRFKGDLDFIQFFPPTLTHLTLILYRGEKGVLGHRLPPSLQELRLRGIWNGDTLSYLPPSLTTLDIACEIFNSPLDHLPASLTHLFIGHTCAFNFPLDHLPSSITYLYLLAPTFQQELNPSTLLNVTHFKFGGLLHSTSTLPPRITHLTFDPFFNGNVDNLPPLITHLTFGHFFNQQVDNLPQHLTHLTFGNQFNQQVIHLPQTLQNLKFGRQFNQTTQFLPPSITHLKLHFFPPNFFFPTNLQEVKFKLKQPLTSPPLFLKCRLCLWRHRIDFKMPN